GLQLLRGQLQPGAERRVRRVGEERPAEALVGDQLAQGLLDGALAHGASRVQGPSPARACRVTGRGVWWICSSSRIGARRLSMPLQAALSISPQVAEESTTAGEGEPED